MVGVRGLCSSTAAAWGQVIKFMTQSARGTEEGRAWLAEGWIHRYGRGRDHAPDAEWVGCGYLSCCGGQQLSQLSHLWEVGTSGGGVRCCEAASTASCKVPGHFREYQLHPKPLLPAEKPDDPGFLNYRARRYRFICLWNTGHTLSFSTEKSYYIVKTLLVWTYTVPIHQDFRL